MALLPMTDLDLRLMRRLETGLLSQRDELLRCNAYYEGRQPLNFMAPALRDELGDRVTELVINWARVVVDAYENRLDVEGFRYPDSDSGDETLWQVWQTRNMDEQSQMAHLDSLALRRSYVMVGNGNGDEPPLVTVESPLQVWADRDPQTRATRAGIKSWVEDDGTQRRALWTPEATVEYVSERGQWFETYRDQHGIGHPGVVVLPNRPRLLAPDGISELVDVMPLADAANKMATDMMISGEFHAMPRRWAFGLKAEDFQDDQGNPISTWKKIAGRIWASESKEVNVGQFPESDLTVFHNTIKMIAAIVAQLAALPPDHLGFGGTNPTSADAIRSAETRLVKRCQRKHTFLGGGWEDVQRLVIRRMTGSFDPRAAALETVWRDPSTPTDAQRADAITKHVQTGVYTIGEGRRQMGLTDTQIKRMEAEEAAAADPVVAGFQRVLDGPRT